MVTYLSDLLIWMAIVYVVFTYAIGWLVVIKTIKKYPAVGRLFLVFLIAPVILPFLRKSDGKE